MKKLRLRELRESFRVTELVSNEVGPPEFVTLLLLPAAGSPNCGSGWLRGEP
jgi:hypothetical protein